MTLFDDATAGAGRVQAAGVDETIARLGRQLPRDVYLGTSSWSFPGWQGIVYGGAYSESMLVRCVGIDRSFHQPLAIADYARYAADVPATFRFLVKAPAQVTDAVLRGERGAPQQDNPRFLHATAAEECFVAPALEGLGERAGPLVFQLPPLPREALKDAGHALIERLGDFLNALPRRVGAFEPLYAVELRDGELLTPRFITIGDSATIALDLHNLSGAAQTLAVAVQADEGRRSRAAARGCASERGAACPGCARRRRRRLADEGTAGGALESASGIPLRGCTDTVRTI